MSCFRASRIACAISGVKKRVRVRPVRANSLDRSVMILLMVVSPLVVREGELVRRERGRVVLIDRHCHDLHHEHPARGGDVDRRAALRC
jgi:hypothetical protein